jgi:hypothetical protein
MKLRIDETYTIFQRLALDFDKARVANHAQHSGLPELKEDLQNHAMEYLTASLDSITFKIQNAEKGFSAINSITSEFLQTKSIESNYRIQKTIVWLTVFIILLTIVSLLSEVTKEAIIKWLFILMGLTK